MPSCGMVGVAIGKAITFCFYPPYQSWGSSYEFVRTSCLCLFYTALRTFLGWEQAL